MRQILLVEPPYRNKYPPLGLMKISTYHKEKGDYVCFAKGCDGEKRAHKWDRIYIATLFTFYWNQTVKTIKYYEKSVNDRSQIIIGGVMATLLKRDIEQLTNATPVAGLLNRKGKIGYGDDDVIDSLVPDYHVLEDICYEYPVNDAYFGYMTRGCKRKCGFCAVHIIEPEFINYIPMKEQKDIIDRKYGEKKDLLLLDNNILASSDFDKITDEILEMGFYKGAKLNNRKRYVDLNQGIDARYLTRRKIKRLAELPVRPLRIAFDDIRMKDAYIKKIKWASELGFARLSNYILFNYKDTPEDFYERLRINIELNKELGLKIYSFPMKFVPVTHKNRRYIGPNWNKRYIRGIQCILNATHGVVGPGEEFFQKAFGRNVDEFKRIILMPDDYIIYRAMYELNGAAEWKDIYSSLSEQQGEKFHSIVFENDFRNGLITDDPSINNLLEHYKNPKLKGT